MFRQLALNELSRIYLSGYYNEQTNIEDETQLIYLQANDEKKTEVALPKFLAKSHSSKLKDEIAAKQSKEGENMRLCRK